MKIESSQLFLNSQHQLERKKVIEESLVKGFSRPGERWSEDTLQQGTVYKRNELSLYNQNGLISNKDIPVSEQTIIPPALATLDINPVKPDVSAIETSTVETGTQQLDARMLLMVTLIEAITGKKIHILNTNSIQSTHTKDIPQSESHTEEAPVAEYGMQYHYSEQTTETENTSFTAQGQIQTTNGKQITIEFEINMSRSFTEHFQIDISEGAAIVKDPLVVNFNGNSAQLTNEKIQFDIDADGIEDSISFVTQDSGFLALDKNNDGLINNGSELFGAISGNGFADLAQYDLDNNHFIDEADEVFKQLKVWVRDQNGNNQLYTLAETNVGAIYLGSADTTFDLKNENNELSGSIRSTGLYLTEGGQVKSIQQLDLVV